MNDRSFIVGSDDYKERPSASSGDPEGENERTWLQRSLHRIGEITFPVDQTLITITACAVFILIIAQWVWTANGWSL